MKDSFRVRGGAPLEGCVKVQGAKNSVLPVLAATLIGKSESVIHNCPRLRDVDTALMILQYLGCRTKVEGSTITVDTSTINRHDIPDSLMREMRSSVFFLGAILAALGRGEMSYPGGCELGPRPIDLHISALRELGVDIREEGGRLYCAVNKPKGKDISLSFPSVGATENIMLAASVIPGKTRIVNAAREPEIVNLQDYLRSAGVEITGAGTPVIEIAGDAHPHGAEHTIMPDRIVTATWLCAAAAAGGRLLVENTCPEHVLPVSAVLEKSGCEVVTGENSIYISAYGRLDAGGVIRTMPYPGFATDAQAVMMALMARANGTTVFIENIFESRYRHVNELLRMGADIKVDGRTAVVCGVPALSGAPVKACDLRGGAALIIAALSAEGESVISGASFVDRGYEDMDRILTSVGASVERV